MSGNCINAADITHASPFQKNVANNSDADALTENTRNSTMYRPSGIVQPESHTKILVADAQITAFAIYTRDNIFAYVEKGSNIVKLVKYVSSTSSVTPISKLEGMCLVNMMCFLTWRIFINTDD